MENFQTLLTYEILKNLNNRYIDNYDYFRFGKKKGPPSLLNKTFNFFKKSFIPFKRNQREINEILINVKKIDDYYEGFNYLYENLSDQESKRLLIKLVAYRILGCYRFKLPLSKPWYWKKIKDIDGCFSNKDIINDYSSKWKLRRINLKTVGYPIDLYHVSTGIMAIFILKHYEHQKVKIEKGDIVIDAGSCWGDVALFFASRIGKHGKVFSFEFCPENLRIFYKNLKLNSYLAKRIKVIEKPLWHSSGKNLFYVWSGPGSRISNNKNNNFKYKISSISIDDFICKKRIRKLDFIKMDIEGSELNALKGAKTTLIKFRPKLAISLYHSLYDFTRIPKYLNQLKLGYQFYLGHYTIHNDETVLFASVN